MQDKLDVTNMSDLTKSKLENVKDMERNLLMA